MSSVPNDDKTTRPSYITIRKRVDWDVWAREIRGKGESEILRLLLHNTTSIFYYKSFWKKTVFKYKSFCNFNEQLIFPILKCR